MLEIKNLTFSYSRRVEATINDFSLSFAQGGVYGLLGENGAGKTTLLQLMCGLLTPRDGGVYLNDTNVRLRLPSVMQDIVIVPEEIELPAMSLSSFVKLQGALYPKFSAEEMQQHLELFGVTEVNRLDQLSMGQKKKVALAFAMACNSRVVLLDEPTNGLDIPGKSAFRRFIAQSVSDERIFIISTHQVRDVAQILDHLLIINNHRVLLDASVAKIQSKLRFIDTINREVVEKSVYSIGGVGGFSVILPNDTGEDTEVNLETLFDFAISNPEKLTSILNS